MNTESPVQEMDAVSTSKARTKAGDGIVSRVMRKLIKESGKTIQTISDESGVPATTLYSITQRNSNRMDILALNTMANYFGVSLSIFCGEESEEAKSTLTQKEMWLLREYNSFTSTAQSKIDDYIVDLAENPKNKEYE